VPYGEEDGAGDRDESFHFADASGWSAVAGAEESVGARGGSAGLAENALEGMSA